jgi:predicted RNA methylase
MFDTMASIAQEVVAHNGFENDIIVINGKSTDIESLPVTPDILISELLDSALLGESCIPSHADAIERFLNTTSCKIRTNGSTLLS